MYPEHEKVEAVKRQSQAIHEFIRWLSAEKKVHLAEWVPLHEGSDGSQSRAANLHYTRQTLDNLVAEFFEVDLKKFQAEKDQMVEEVMRIAKEGCNHPKERRTYASPDSYSGVDTFCTRCEKWFVEEDFDKKGANGQPTV